MSDFEDEEFEKLAVAAVEQAEREAAPKQFVPKLVSKSVNHNVLVSFRQKGNPLLPHLRNVPWEYSEIVPDFVMGAKTCALFLSLKYHHVHPEYIYSRIGKLGKAYELRILLAVVDVENHRESIQELVKTSVVNRYTLILAWSSAEAARYIETYKAFEFAAPTNIMERPSTDYLERVQNTFTSIRGINKSDCLSLIAHFGSMKRALTATQEELEQIDGFGPTKVRRFLEATHQPFRSQKVVKAVKQTGHGQQKKS
ncbi:DNA repair endonuclease Swi10 [Schizosaccharomyces japonicus yFS275]|uniref:DNA repair endonuclease Swi10 n=1 Tax=Schizosaccharomyces japonicus (strain yFS275 / FY16936) TaxID=402676 RepID=B6K1A3_SCHJY|nr:DNA repair endonuclease Swi10 [Schizosaccharomyces japonicus yFS275]EEB07724.2 DNA repair endonuclease Swi10 [Schizosaccharomyces japonicus yFS275]